MIHSILILAVVFLAVALCGSSLCGRDLAQGNARTAKLALAIAITSAILSSLLVWVAFTMRGL